jgi:hypothetical protein
MVYCCLWGLRQRFLFGASLLLEAEALAGLLLAFTIRFSTKAHSAKNLGCTRKLGTRARRRCTMGSGALKLMPFLMH